MTLTELSERWNNFWYRSICPAPLCLLRIGVGVISLCCGLLWLPYLETLFGPDGIVSVPAVYATEPGAHFSLLFGMPQTNQSVWIVFSILIVTAITTTFGLFTRASLGLLFIALVSFHNRNPHILNSGDTLLVTLIVLLLVSPCHLMFSLDRLRSKSRSTSDQWDATAFIWSTRLIQIQIAAVYCQTFLAKIGSEMWRDGTAVYWISRLEEFQRFPVPYLFDHMWTIKLLTWSTLGIECALWTLIWIKEFRYWVLLAGILLHLGIEWSMNIPLFEWLMITSYIIFVEPDDIKKVFDRVFKKSKRLHVVSDIPTG